MLYLGWAGTNSSHNLNVLRSYYGTDWNNSYKYTLGDTSGGGVALSMFSGSAGNQMYVAWVGSDINHYLQIGYFNGTTTLQNVPGPLGIGGLDNSFWTNSGYDASLAVVGTTLYYPYAGGYDNLNVAHSTNAQNWSDDTFQTIGAQEGVGGTNYGGTLWMAWSNYDQVVRLGTYTP